MHSIISIETAQQILILLLDCLLQPLVTVFGNVADFGGQTQPTGPSPLVTLIPHWNIHFLVLHREMLLTIESNVHCNRYTTTTVFLNAASNASQVASFQIKPDAGGNIVLSAEPGPNNSNGSKFYYLGAVTLIYPEQNEPTVVTKIQYLSILVITYRHYLG